MKTLDSYIRQCKSRIVGCQATIKFISSSSPRDHALCKAHLKDYNVELMRLVGISTLLDRELRSQWAIHTGHGLTYTRKPYKYRK